MGRHENAFMTARLRKKNLIDEGLGASIHGIERLSPMGAW